MSQLYEKKCDCKYYDDLNDHGATLLKMELPEYEAPYSGSGYLICRALRFMGYVTVAVLLSYSLWRIHVIESTLLASDRLHNITRTIALESVRSHPIRVTRSVPVGHHADVNSIGTDKDLPRGSMLTAKNEFVPAKRRRPADEREFEYLVSSLFDKIQMMHNDTDRSHLHSNMKAVFQAWFPVFDALLPEELVDGQLEMLTESTASANGRVERSISEEGVSGNEGWRKIEKNFPTSMDRMKLILARMQFPPNDVKDSMDDVKLTVDNSYTRRFSDDNEIKSGDNKNGYKQRLVRSIADKTSEDSSEEEKQKSTGTAADKTSEESSEENKPRNTRSAIDKTSEECLEDKKQRFERSISTSSDESKSSSEEEKRRVKYNKNNKSKESSEEQEKKDKPKKEKSSEESAESSESAESKEKKKDKEKNELFYQVVSSDQDGSKTIVQVN